MIRKIIVIDEEKCNGCGACAAACHEGAIGMVNGKAKLLRDDYCDGLGDCLPACPANAISFTHREAAAYDEKAVQANKLAAQQAAHPRHAGGCPGTRMRQMRQRNHTEDAPPIFGASQLAQWPCSAHRSGLHCLRLRCHASNISAWENYVNRMPQAGRCQLCRKADTDSPQQ